MPKKKASHVNDELMLLDRQVCFGLYAGSNLVTVACGHRPVWQRQWAVVTLAD